MTYTGVLFTEKIKQAWNAEAGRMGIVRDTLNGAYYAQSINPSINASFNPQIFGTYQFINPESRVQAIRHVIKPSVSFNYVPVFRGLSSKVYEQVQVDTTGLNYRQYSIFEGSIYQPPSLSTKSGTIGFNIANLVEAKIFEKNDTTGKPKTVRLLDNFGISTGYNIFADSMRWAPVSMQLRTTLANNFNISASGSFSLYGIDKNGKFKNTFAFAQDRKLMRLTNFNTSFDVSISDLLKGNKDKNRSAATPNALTGGVQEGNPTGSNDLSQKNTGAGLRDAYGYPVFDVPWTMNMSYNLNYYKTGFRSVVSQALTLSGSVSFTKKMAMTYTTGYDFTGKQITMTQIGISRDLHCWEMNFNWVPNGTMKMWNFTIRVKASVLGDLKYERRKDFHDTY
jgi:hypothetical protein